VFAAGVVIGIASRSEQPCGCRSDNGAADEHDGDKQKGSVEPATEQVGGELPKDDDRKRGDGIHPKDDASTALVRTRLSLRRAIDEVVGAGLGWSAAFVLVVGLYASAVGLRYDTETLEIFAIAVSGLAAVVLAEGFMNVLIGRLGYVALGFLIAFGLGVAAVDLTPLRWLQGWVAAGALFLALLGLTYVGRQRRKRATRSGARHDRAEARKMYAQIIGLLLVAVALALQARIAIFDHPAAARAAASAEQKADRLSSQFLIVDGKPAAVLARLSRLEGEVCRLKARSLKKPPAHCAPATG
jgi:hypothetical protein